MNISENLNSTSGPNNSKISRIDQIVIKRRIIPTQLTVSQIEKEESKSAESTEIFLKKFQTVNRSESTPKNTNNNNSFAKSSDKDCIVLD